MDRPFDVMATDELWSGVVQSVLGEAQFQSLAHGQPVSISGLDVPEGRRVMLYDWKIASNDPYVLASYTQSHSVLIPTEGELDFTSLKEACAGLGCIGIGAHQLGITTVATMDINPKAVYIQTLNKVPNALHGDVLRPADRFRLHVTPQPLRCWISSGFPCQPLSTQGDMKGQQDSRSGAFFASLQLAWEQGAAGLLLECVPGAAHADYVQQGLQKLAWSLGWSICQRILHLHHAWPCKRTRWWALLAPRPYVPLQISDLPNFPEMHHVVALFPHWPIWPPQEEGLLQVTDNELAMYSSPTYGSDIRHLQSNQPCPCILHSYASVLQACPCGCREYPFSPQRLVQGGVRGFYIRSSRTGQLRHLHVREAAAMCAIPPTMVFPGSGRDCLCFVGQSASPMQALWMWANFFRVVVPDALDPQYYVTAYIMHLFKEIHGGFLFDELPAQVQFRRQGEQDDQMRRTPSTTIAQWKKAEQKLQGWGCKIAIADEQGPLPDHHLLQSEALLGSYTMTVLQKQQVAPLPQGTVGHCLRLSDGAIHASNMAVGSFLFQLVDGLQLPHDVEWIDEFTQELIPLDTRLWSSTSLVQAGGRQIQAAGWTHTGLGNFCLDWMARKIIRQTSTNALWMPSQMATLLLTEPDFSSYLLPWATILLHAPTFTCVAVDGHWVLLRLTAQETMLLVDCWDGLQKHIGSDQMPGLFAVCGRLGLRPMLLQHHCRVQQTLPMTCGAVALLHLALELHHITDTSPVLELSLHKTLHDHFFQYDILTAMGPNGLGKGGDTTLLWTLRDILEAHGVPASRTEERANLAVSKIGAVRIQEALNARNQWAALKALGSQPKINFMWVKPDELEVQIKNKAQAKFRIQTSNKKQAQSNRGPVSSHQVDPTMLKLLPEAFVTEDGHSVAQIDISQVEAHRAGLAYGTLEDAAPFLREDRSISFDGFGHPYHYTHPS